MARKDKKKSIGIKTTRYFTKTCTKCNFEYPNWFTNCPKCGAAWNENEVQQSMEPTDIHTKTIKIVVKITEEDFSEKLEEVKLMFSADQGKSWYQMRMDNEIEYFIAEIADVPVGSLIIYYIEVILGNGEKVIENNDNNYFLYKVGMALEDSEKPQPTQELDNYSGSNQSIKKKRKEFFIPKGEKSDTRKNSAISAPQKATNYRANESDTIFGTPQTTVDPDLKICPYCNSKIKKMWSTCPICGKNI